MLDRDLLLAYLAQRAKDRGTHDTSGLVITAILDGLATRIRNGDFDIKEEENG